MAKRWCKALQRGFCGVKLREPGEAFLYDGKPAYWFEEMAEEPEVDTPEEDEGFPDEFAERQRKAREDIGAPPVPEGEPGPKKRGRKPKDLAEPSVE